MRLLAFRKRLNSYKVGEELAHQQLGAAELLIRKEFASNQYFYLSAQEAVRTTIQCLVRQMNPGVENYPSMNMILCR